MKVNVVQIFKKDGDDDDDHIDDDNDGDDDVEADQTSHLS